MSIRHQNQTKVLYIPIPDFENFIIIANRLPIDTNTVNMTHAINQNAVAIMLTSKRWPIEFPLNILEIMERVAYKYRIDLWRKMKIQLKWLKP